MIHLLKIVWTYILATWSIWNQHLHHDARQLSLPNYLQAVTTIYKLSSQQLPAVQEALFSQPLNQMLEQPPACGSVKTGMLLLSNCFNHF